LITEEQQHCQDCKKCLYLFHDEPPYLTLRFAELIKNKKPTSTHMLPCEGSNY
jgi:hypothetical protein